MNSPRALYAQYLTSSHWRKLQLSVRRRANFRCECCHRATAAHPEVHHTYYGDQTSGGWLDVTTSDLIALCPRCHKRAHEPACLACVSAASRGKGKRLALLRHIRAPLPPLPSRNPARLAAIRLSAQRVR